MSCQNLTMKVATVKGAEKYSQETSYRLNSIARNISCFGLHDYSCFWRFAI